MRFEFGPGEGVATLLRHHGTDLERFSPHSIKAITESLQIATDLGSHYASVGHLLVRMSIEDEPYDDQTRRIMEDNGLTTERIVESLRAENGHLPPTEVIRGVETDYRELLVSVDYGQLFYPGLPREPEQLISSLDLLHNAVMWTHGSIAPIVSDLGVSPEKVVRDCRVQRWYSRRYFKNPKEPFPLKRRHRRLRSTTLQQEG